ncbi:MAG: cyclic nucleotide-binding domain-containing protein [Gammaproteobacteria bacterium]|nr:MAG: cyclic nucleotide-binding domain-containing protein [Gammaproteobacteria bacterium]
MQPRKHLPTLRAEFDLSLTRTLVPLKDMSEAHLLELLSNSETDVICAGQTIFVRGSYDAHHVYLLHGNVSLVDENNMTTIVNGRSSLLPIAHHQPRRVTATAESDCSILRLDSDRLDKLMAWSQVADYLQLNISRQRDLDEDIDWMMTVLKSNLFFKVPPINVEEIFSRLTPQVVYAGDVVIRQGELGDQCYFLKEGDAEVWRHNETGRQLLATVGVGRCFGEDALVNEAPRNASVIMLTDGVLMRLDKQDFYRLLKEPQVASISLEAYSEQLAAGAVAVDVRNEEEYAELHMQSAVNIPLNLLGIKSRMLDKNRAYIFYCDTGRRSRAAAHLLTQQGYQALALDDCAHLFGHSRWRHLLDNRSNYVLRDGQAHKGQ